MIVLKSWLKDYIDIPWDSEGLVKHLTDVGSLVDSYFSTLDDRIVTAKILKIQPHPNADRLRLARVSDGTEQYDVVCGAPNIEEGQIVPFAKVGAKVGDVHISVAEIRGETSNGMLCSERELGIGDDHEGILILPSDTKLGLRISDIYNDDLVMDLEITPNRGDCLSHLGVAREIASLTAKSIAKEPISLQMVSQPVSAELTVKIDNINLCPRYLARKINNVKIGPSPEWLQKRLILCGLKPINNVVDITNYIMIDLGQPLHAFDASKVSNGSIIVRKAKKGETIKILDGSDINLETSDLLIADETKAIAIAGVMGGYDSQITHDTTDVILEAAEFDRISVRRTSKIHNLTTDASYRFERGIDPALVEYSLNKAAKLIREIAGGTILQGIVKQDTEIIAEIVPFECSDINRLLGTELKDDEIKVILKHRGFKIEGNDALIPSWRHDIERWQDLAEEVMCVYGLENISLKSVPKSSSPKRSAYYYKEYLKNILVATGFSEVYNYSFMSEKEAKAAKLKTNELLEVVNPVSPEIKYMRNSLIPGMIASVSRNPSFDPILIFEVGNVFDKKGEYTHLCVMSSGSGAENTIRKAAEDISKIIKGAVINVDVLSRDELNVYKVKKPAVFYFDLSLENISKLMEIDEAKLNLKIDKKDITYRPISKYPSVTRDLAFIVDKDLPAREVETEIYSISEMINRVELFDEFASDKFGKNKKNLAFHIFLQAPDRTLKDTEADEIINNVIETVEKKYKAKLRTQ